MVMDISQNILAHVVELLNICYTYGMAIVLLHVCQHVKYIRIICQISFY